MTLTPFFRTNADEVAARIASLMPAAAPLLTPEEAAAQAQRQAEASLRWTEARFGELPEGTYRLLGQGGVLGFYFELEIDGETVVLRAEDGAVGSEFSVSIDSSRVLERACAEVALRHGPEAAARAKFVSVVGGVL